MAKYTAEIIAKWLLKYNEFVRDIENEDTDQISNLKLQKLLYYCQGAFLAIKNEKLFEDDILAWTHGPVIEEIYQEYKKFGAGGITEIPNEKVLIDEETREVLINTYNTFGKYSAWGLRNLTHNETPWTETKKNDVISTDKIKKYFRENYIGN